MGIRPQKIPLPTHKLPEMFLNKRKWFSEMSAKMPCKHVSDTKRIMIKKANASKLKQADYVYNLQQKADHQGSEIPFTDFQWIGPYIIEKVLRNNKDLVRRIGTNKTQVLHRTRLRQFTPRQRIPKLQITRREWKPDPEVIIKHDNLYARAW